MVPSALEVPAKLRVPLLPIANVCNVPEEFSTPVSGDKLTGLPPAIAKM